MDELKPCEFCLKIHDSEECKKEDLQEALEYYETKRFHHQMKDGWKCEDFELDTYYYCKIQAIKRKLNLSGKVV